MLRRLRRNRRTDSIRRLCSETALAGSDLVMPLFVTDGSNEIEEIGTMPGVFRYSTDRIVSMCDTVFQLGIPAVALFPKVPDTLKDSMASYSYAPSNFYLECIRNIKKSLPELTVITDVAMDPYNSDGHDGIVAATGEIVNDASLEVLSKMALAQANAGADIIAPSDMMDGRIKFIRRALDAGGHGNTLLLSYAVKYASAFYGPFREALGSTPKSGNKKTYQMNPENQREAILEAEIDVDEGADMLMVKPGLPYLDVVCRLKSRFNLPIAAYNVSGEYAALKFASLHGAIDYKNAVLETLTSFKRAGADFILTYHAVEAIKWLNDTEL